MSLSVKITTARGKIPLLIICLMLAATTLSAQTTSIITLTKESITLSSLFKEIEKQTNSVVITNVGKIDRSREVVLSKKEGTIGEILDQALSGTGHTYRINGRYVIVLPIEKEELQQARQATAILPVSGDPSQGQQPTQAEFERDVKEYARQNLTATDSLQEISVRYDTIKTERLHDGKFKYPNQSIKPSPTKRLARTPFSQDTPPLIAIKTNLVWAATLTPNLSAEIGLGKRTSLELSGGNNRWNLDGKKNNNKKLVHWVIKSEFRYWLCERFNGHFFGVHAFYGKYNVSGYDIPLLFNKEYRYQGNGYGGGVSYGYHWMWSKRWGMEFTAGVGVAQMEYIKKDCEKCGNEVGHYNKTYFGPTSLGVKLIFVIK